MVMLSEASGQGIFKKLGDRTMNKIQRKAEDKLVDELSEKLANEAVKPIDSFMDSLFAASYEEQTGEKYDPANNARMGEALNAFLGSVELPESYEFEYLVEIDLKDFGSKKTEKMEMLVSKSRPFFGIKQNNDGKEMMVIFDNENGAMVSYDLEENSYIALPVNSALMASFSGMSNTQSEALEIDFRKTGKTKKIIGYQAEEYEVTSKDTESEVYVSKEVPFTWDESFGTMLNQFAPHFYQQNEEYRIDGMLMEALTERASDGKKSEWRTKKIEAKSITIDNADYKRTEYGS